MRIERRTFLYSLVPLAAAQQESKKGGAVYPPVMDGAVEEVYKDAGGVPLKLWIFNPQGHKSGNGAPAIVFFFGGGWQNGNPKQFEPHCRHLAARGMVAITADYRVASRHKVKAVDCLRDAKSAIRYVRANAKRLGADPARIAAGGGSAGGHLAAATATIAAFDEPKENAGVSSKPNALVLFNPAVNLVRADLEPRMGVPPRELSPSEHVQKGVPPTIIFHGKADTTVPYASVEDFTAKMRAAGNRCELEGYDGATHGFFNYGRGGNEHYEATVARATSFLHSLGYLKSS